MAAGFRTKRKSPEKKKINSLEVGDSGTRILDGVISEEYNSKLADTRGMAIYEEMRKSDGTVRFATQIVKLPLLSAQWRVKPGTDDEQGQEIADFVHKNLFEYQQLKFRDFFRQALLAFDFGVMVFEKVFEVREIDGVEYVVWKSLAPRLPKSIMKWSIAGDKPGIVQNKQKTSPVDIPMEKLIVFVNEKEGDNWWGTSLLRAAYKHWYMKVTLEKIDAIAHERQGIGIPEVVMPEGATASDRQTAENIAKNIRANSQAHVIRPKDYEVGFMDMKSGGTKDASPSLAYHSREIMKCVLAAFMELGSTSGGGTGGSRALSEDHSKIFLQAEEFYAQWICDTMEPHIKELVDYNFDGVKEYPKLDFEGITEENVQNLASTYASLKGAGAMTAQDADEASFRDKLGLPVLEESGIREEEPEEDPNNQPPKNKKESSEHGHIVKKKSFGEFKPFRKLTFAEEKVDFQKLASKMDELEAQFDSDTKALLHEARDAYMAALTKAAHAGDTQAIKDATLKVQSDYARIIKNSLKSAFEYGKNNAAKEIGVAAPANPSEMLRQIDIQSDAIAEQQIAAIVGDSKSAYVQALNKGESLAVALGAADAAASALIDELTSDAAAILMSGYINHGRGLVFDRNADDVHGLQRSEILDEATCNYCLSIDGRIVEKDDPFASNTIFHSNCRGIWVAIMKDEEELPRIDGIPAFLRDRFGDAVNDLIQLKNPRPKRK